MNTQRLKNSKFKLTAVISSLLLLFFSQNALAQSDKAAPPPDAYAAIQVPAPTFPNYSWPYMSAVPGTSSLPTQDLYGAQYLPYMPWLGTNIALLVNYADFFYQLEKNNTVGGAPYMAPVTALANNTLSTTKDDTAKSAGETTSTDVNSVLSNQDPSIVTYKLVSIPGTDTTIPCKNQVDCNLNPPPKNEAFNADTLLATSGFPADKADQMNNLITFLTSMTDPIPTIELSSDPTERASQLQSADIQRYILMVRTLAAAQSMALSNFNFLAQERQIVPDLGSKAGMTTLPTDGHQTAVKDASQLQLEEFLVNRRIGNSEWYAAVNTAPSVAVQRETLFVLAEMQQQLAQLRMLNERLLATMTVMQMQMTQFNKSSIQTQQQAISDNIDQANESKQ